METCVENAAFDILNDKWKEKRLSAKQLKIANNTDFHLIDLTHQWLLSSGLQSETEGFNLDSPDHRAQQAATRQTCLIMGSVQRVMYINSKMTTIDQAVSICSLPAPTKYSNMHDKAALYIYN